MLVIFGGRNTDGNADASGRMGWGKWCDDNGIFLVAPGLKNDNYWEPEAWSGKALQKALRQLKQKFGDLELPVNQMLPEGIRIFNPGSISLPKQNFPQSFGFWDGERLSVRRLDDGREIEL